MTISIFILSLYRAEFNIQGDPEAAQIVFNFGANIDIHHIKASSSASDFSSLTSSTTPTSQATSTRIVHDLDHDDYRVPIILIPLEVTHTVLVSDEILEQVSKLTYRGPKKQDSTDPVSTTDANTSSCKFAALCRSLLLFFGETYRAVFKFDHGPPLHDPAAVFYAINREYFTAKLYRVDVELAGTHSRGQTVVDIWGQSGRVPNVTVGLTLDVDVFWREMMDVLDRVAQLGVMDG